MGIMMAAKMPQARTFSINLGVRSSAIVPAFILASAACKICAHSIAHYIASDAPTISVGIMRELRLLASKSWPSVYETKLI